MSSTSPQTIAQPLAPVEIQPQPRLQLVAPLPRRPIPLVARHQRSRSRHHHQYSHHQNPPTSPNSSAVGSITPDPHLSSSQCTSSTNCSCSRHPSAHPYPRKYATVSACFSSSSPSIVASSSSSSGSSMSRSASRSDAGSLSSASHRPKSSTTPLSLSPLLYASSFSPIPSTSFPSKPESSRHLDAARPSRDPGRGEAGDNAGLSQPLPTREDDADRTPTKTTFVGSDKARSRSSQPDESLILDREIVLADDEREEAEADQGGGGQRASASSLPPSGLPSLSPSRSTSRSASPTPPSPSASNLESLSPSPSPSPFQPQRRSRFASRVSSPPATATVVAQDGISNDDLTPRKPTVPTHERGERQQGEEEDDYDEGEERPTTTRKPLLALPIPTSPIPRKMTRNPFERYFRAASAAVASSNLNLNYQINLAAASLIGARKGEKLDKGDDDDDSVMEVFEEKICSEEEMHDLSCDGWEDKEGHREEQDEESKEMQIEN